MSKEPQNIDQYISAFSPEIQSILKLIRDTIHTAVPEVQESIRYGMPAFQLNGEHIYISANKKHIGMYPMYGIKELEEELKPYRGKGTKDAIHFLYTAPPPIALIEKIVKLKANKTPL